MAGQITLMMIPSEKMVEQITLMVAPSGKKV